MSGPYRESAAPEKEEFPKVFQVQIKTPLVDVVFYIDEKDHYQLKSFFERQAANTLCLKYRKCNYIFSLGFGFCFQSKLFQPLKTVHRDDGPYSAGYKNVPFDCIEDYTQADLPAKITHSDGRRLSWFEK